MVSLATYVEGQDLMKHFLMGGHDEAKEKAQKQLLLFIGQHGARASTTVSVSTVAPTDWQPAKETITTPAPDGLACFKTPTSRTDIATKGAESDTKAATTVTILTPSLPTEKICGTSDFEGPVDVTTPASASVASKSTRRRPRLPSKSVAGETPQPLIPTPSNVDPPQRKKNATETYDTAIKIYHEFIGGNAEEIQEIRIASTVDTEKFGKISHLEPLATAVALLSRELTPDDRRFCLAVENTMRGTDGRLKLEAVSALIEADPGIPLAKKNAAAAIFSIVGQQISGFTKKTLSGDRGYGTFPQNNAKVQEALKGGRSPLRIPEVPVFIFGGTAQDIKRVKDGAQLRGGIALDMRGVGLQYGEHYLGVQRDLRQLKTDLERVADVQSGLFTKCGVTNT